VYPATTPGHNLVTLPLGPKRSDAALRRTLDAFLANADRPALVARDPVEAVHRYRNPHDQEVVGIVVAMLAYGRAATIKVTTQRVLALLGDVPAEAVDRGRVDALDPFVYRFQKKDDLARFVRGVGRVRKEHGSLAAAFGSVVSNQDANYAPAMSRFIELIARAIPGKKTYGLRFLLPSGAAKRLCLYLRWMIRDDDGLDLGTWKGFEPRKLIIPLDTHITRLGRYLGLTDRATPNLAMAIEITQSLARLRPDDPLAYDMALCHLGISEQCPRHRDPEICATCPINDICRLGPRQA
jgi:uncharacterized protein (TIGR02757 family)